MLLLIGLVVLIVLLRALARRATSVTVFEHRTALAYKNGSFARELGPGRYRTWWPGTHIVVYDLRERSLTLPGQEMLTADTLTVKSSLVVRHRITHPRRLVAATTDYSPLIYADSQVALRQVIAGKTLEEVLAERGEVGTAVRSALAAKWAERGIEVLEVAVRDLMLSGEAKRAYADIFRARKEGEAALERARGETTALRSLASGARLLKDNPALFQIRLLQTLTTSASKGATIVLNAGGEPPWPGAVTPPPAPDTSNEGVGG